jgi:hypothetical protein
MDGICELKTDGKLLEALGSASLRKKTTEELHEQRVSFIYASMDKDSGVTRAKIEEVLAEQLGK